MRRWRRATLHAIGWYAIPGRPPCYRGGLIIRQQMNGWTAQREYVVRATPSGRFHVEHAWSMK